MRYRYSLFAAVLGVVLYTSFSTLVLSNDQEEIPEDFKALMEGSASSTGPEGLQGDAAKLKEEIAPREELPADFKALMGNDDDAGHSLSKDIVARSDEGSSSSSSQRYEYSSAEAQRIFYTFAGLLAFNFVLYALIPVNFIRALLVATPLGIKVFGRPKPGARRTYVRRYGLELIFLPLFLFLLLASIGAGKTYALEDIDRSTVEAATVFAMVWLGYIVIRGIIASITRCPDCRTAFASSTDSSEFIPTTTFQKHLENGPTQTWAAGVVQSHKHCIVCNHQWTTSRSSKRQID